MASLVTYLSLMKFSVLLLLCDIFNLYSVTKFDFACEIILAVIFHNNYSFACNIP